MYFIALPSNTKVIIYIIATKTEKKVTMIGNITKIIKEINTEWNPQFEIKEKDKIDKIYSDIIVALITKDKLIDYENIVINAV